MLFPRSPLFHASLDKPTGDVDTFDDPTRVGLNERANPSNTKLTHLSVVSIPHPDVETITINGQPFNDVIVFDRGAAEFTHYKLPARQVSLHETNGDYSSANAHPGERT